MKKYIVKLSVEERSTLGDIVNKGKQQGYKRLKAQILLLCDEGEHGKNYKDTEIVRTLDTSLKTIERTREQCVMFGIEAAISRAKGSSSKRKKLDGDGEAHLIALACSDAPEGRSTWTLKLLANKMVELNYIDAISPSTIGRTLKKTN
jgi:hypothetical protein